VGTGGASAGLAKQLRLRLEGLIPGNLGKLADALQSVRAAWRERWPDAADRRRALDAALAPGGPLDPLADGSADKVAGWLKEADAPATGEPVELTIASDDPDDLTLRQARLLGNADCIVFDPGIAPAVLARARADAVRLPSPHEGDLPGGLVLILRRAS
jgi:uroporphyrin-III C-methyltransferase/precorrin-2 dehydrogenase/sirohydrochlorin ferrochelatase